MSEEKKKPVLDERALARLLEAAYVLQEHNREMRDLELRLELKRDVVEAEERAQLAKTPSPPPVTSYPPSPAPDYTQVLAKIVEIQHHIQVRRLELENALNLVAERVLEMAHAAGVAIGLTDGKIVRYRAVAGRSTPELSASIPLDLALFLPCLKTGQVLRCPHINAEFLLDSEECQRRGIASLIAVPIFHEGAVAGGLELYYDSPDAFTEQDVHTCQLMAGLVTEALAREEESSWKKSLADERAAILQALEKLQPSLVALVDGPSAKTAPPAESKPAAAGTYSCPQCGHHLMAEEQFCGQCGTPRAGDYQSPSLQSKVASLWHMQDSQNHDVIAERTNISQGDAKTPNASDSFVPDPALASSLEQHIQELFSDSDLEIAGERQNETPSSAQELTAVEDDAASDHPSEESSGTTQALAPAQLTHPANWSSAASAREFLEQLSTQRQSAWVRFWNSHRGDIYLAIAVILVLCVIRWGIWADHSVRATSGPAATANQSQPKASPDANLSLFDRLLISLGLAEAPETPEDRGNPTVQVWVDLRTALYYCPGTDLYGKTAQGKFTSQREAQLDQFEPAYRKACN